MSRPQTPCCLQVISCACLLPFFIVCVHARAQAIAAGPSSEEGGRSAAASTNGAGPAGIVPATHGFNASLGTAVQHDSSSGWATILTPGVAYRFNSVLSLDASVPVYASLHSETNTGTKTHPVYTSTTKHGVPGDAAIAAHVDTHSSLLDYNGTVTLGLPTGKTAYGIGAGKPTGDFNNHFEKDLGIFTPDIELGIGSSSNLIGRRIRKSYTSLGPLAHFQAGTSVDLPLDVSFEVEGYEELPLSVSNIYSVTGAGRKKAHAAVTNSAEDNGFTTALDVPLGSHVTFSGFFYRSVRTNDDITGLSATFLLQSPGRSDIVQ